MRASARTHTHAREPPCSRAAQPLATGVALAAVKEVLVAPRALAVLMDAVTDGPVALADVVLGAVLGKVAAQPVAVDRDEGRHRARARRGHHLIVQHARHVRAHVAHQHVRAAEHLEGRRQAEGHVLVEVRAELHPSLFDELLPREVEVRPVEALLLGQLLQHLARRVVGHEQHGAHAVLPLQLPQHRGVYAPAVAVAEAHSVDLALLCVPGEHGVERAGRVGVSVAGVALSHVHRRHGRALLVGTAAAVRPAAVAQQPHSISHIARHLDCGLGEDLRDPRHDKVLH
mmetsp:Transcript_40930/g.98212  ORF Transcript_40930/g.98212 Transcript_40930/m.98212 type:complete len:287 (+) Transcript_40930:90-950(+)